MRKAATASQRQLNNIRLRLRSGMEQLALTHRGCDRPRGCGCMVDQALTVLEQAEAKLFQLELNSYADPKTPRREVAGDNSVTFVKDDDAKKED